MDGVISNAAKNPEFAKAVEPVLSKIGDAIDKLPPGRIQDSLGVVKYKIDNIKGAEKAGNSARLGQRRISNEVYEYLRGKTPSRAIRDMVNEGKKPPFPDEALPGLQVTQRLQADHIVPMETIVRMDGFGKLSTEQQLKVLNNPENFIGLSETANKSKGAKSFEEWTVFKKEGIPVNEEFRQRMISVELNLLRDLQQQIDNFVILNTRGN